MCGEKQAYRDPTKIKVELKKSDWREYIGPVLAITGSTLSLFGALVNNLFLMHTLAMWFWMASNPVLLVYFIGLDSHWWNGQHLSTRALISLYFIFTISNFYGLWLI